MGKTKILLVDDQVLFVQSLKIVIENLEKELCVCGIALNGKDAIKLADTLQPNLILMDIRMPVIDGVEAAKEILKNHPKMRIIMLTTFDDDAYVTEAIDIGAAGYLLKDRPPEHLIAAMHAVMEGGTLITPKIARRFIKSTTGRYIDEDSEYNKWNEILTSREIQLLELISKGYSNKEIAEEMNVAEQTVKNYTSMLYSKIGIHSRYNLIAKAKKYFNNP